MKRIFDMVVIFSGFILLLPLVVLIAVLVRLKLGFPIFFNQERPGLNGKIFNMYKFRTMTNERDKDGYLLSDKFRLTQFGKLLRSTSLDELPGIWSVLKGDMSLVGPRPLLVEYLPLYSKKQSRRHEVRPGITGWAQVNGRNAISWDEKFDLDVWYVDNQSIWLDIKILLMTVKKIILRDGISQSNHATVDKFKGSLKKMVNRFSSWEYPDIKDGEPTKYNWIVQNPDGLDLGFETDIGAFSYINALHDVVIENNVQIGSHCSIYSVSTIDSSVGKVVLKNNCRIGSHSTVLPGVTIGKNSIVGAHSLVNKDIPDNVVAFGVPAKVVRKLNNDK